MIEGGRAKPLNKTLKVLLVSILEYVKQAKTIEQIVAYIERLIETA